MRQEIKITLPLFKIAYSVIFMVLIILVRPIGSLSEIISALEPNIALLAGIFMADNYYKEYWENRISTFYRYPTSNKYRALIKRSVISWVYLMLLVAISYLGFVWFYQPANYTTISNVEMYKATMVACGASMFFMGAFSFTFTNLFQSLGAGIGITLLLWLSMTSTIRDIFPSELQLFCIVGGDIQAGSLQPYYQSRIIYFIIGACLLGWNYFLIKKQPGQKKKGRIKYGNQN